MLCTTGLKENEKQMSQPRAVTISKAMRRTRAEGGSVPVSIGEMGKASNQSSRRVAGGEGDSGGGGTEALRDRKSLEGLRR